MTSLTEVAIQPLFLGGEWVTAGAHLEVRLPFDGNLIGRAAKADLGLVEVAVDAAADGAKAMSRMEPGERAELLTRLQEIVKRDAADFSHILCLETGKPIKEARIEVGRCLQTLLWSAIEARQLRGEVVPVDGRLALTLREPVGVIAAITPFNFPLNLAMHKIGPALAGGNSVIHKPSEKTPLTALRLARAMEEAGVPRGAYNVLNGIGSEIAPRLASHPKVNMVTFTGSVPVGKSLKATAGFKRVTLELGNNSAVIIDRDADLAAAVPRCVTGAFSNSGQVCISVQRILVHETAEARFVEAFKTAAEALRIGHPLEESTDVSSLINEDAAKRVVDWIGEALVGGARLITGGGRRLCTVQPTILANVPESCKLACQEAFGPVVIIQPFRDLDEAIAAANDSPYGLQMGIYSNDIQRAFSAARRLRAGGVLINDVPAFRVDQMPYGGVKDSGLGREGPKYALEEMTELKTVIWNG